MTNFLPKVISVVCFIWMLSFPLLGGGSKGKEWFGNMAAIWIGDKKGGVPMLMIAMPLLLMSSMAAVLAIRSNDSNSYNYCYYDRLPRIFHRLYYNKNKRGDVHWNQVGLIFIFIPLVVYLFSNMYRHLQGHKDYTYSKKVMEVANSFGMMAVVSTSFLLVPVSKQGPLLQLFGIDQIQVTCLHIWCGRIFVIGSILHGGLHMYRWDFNGESIWNLIFPPAPCWTMDGNSNFEPTCVHSHTDCTCYHHFRNFTGVVAVWGMIVLLCFSLHLIRRHFYKLFYMSHIVAAPLVLIATVMHYNKAILYIAGSLLYYLACSVPGWIESSSRSSLCRKSDQRIQIVSVQNLEGAAMGRPCVSVTIAASEVALQRYQPGMYVYVSVPEISCVSHPVTINTVPNQPKQLRIIFREIGPWTRALGKQILQSPMFVSGFNGCPNRVAQVLQHDVSVIVAAGIGITPYLSLLSSQSLYGTGKTQILLHWICRDAKLVDYVRKEYFEPLLLQQQASSNSNDYCRIQIMVHRTGGDDMVAATMFTDEPQEEEEASDLEKAMSSEECSGSTAGVPFNPSRFSVGSRSRRGNLCGALAFLSIAWVGLWIVWYYYSNVQQAKQVSQRIYAPLAILLLSLLVAVLVNVVPNRLVGELDPIVTRRHHGNWWDRVNENDDSDEEDSSPIEMASLGDNPQLAQDDGGVVGVCQSVTIIDKQGRPTIADLLEGAWDARSPGLFCCAPPQLVRDLHNAAEEHCFGGCVQAKIAVYNESFQI